MRLGRAFKCLLLFTGLFDVCMAQTIALDTDSSLAIWYKLDSANPELNSGFIGSAANFPNYHPGTSAAFTTTTNSIRGDASHPMLNYMATSNSWTQPSAQSLTFSFWFFTPSADNLKKDTSWKILDLMDFVIWVNYGKVLFVYDQHYYTEFDVRLLDDRWTLFTVNLNPASPLLFYVNGVLQYTGTNSGLVNSLFSPTVSWNLKIGQAGAASQTDMDAHLVWRNSRMDDFRLYTRKLTDSEIMSLYTLVNMPCVPGYTGTTGNCVPCISATYKDSTGSATCTACQGYRTSRAASTAPGACTCNAGYTGTECSPCVVGKYKRIVGTDACMFCGFGQKAFYPGTVECVDPEHCLPGYAHEIQYVTGYSISCAACPAGKRGLGGMTEQCRNCPDYQSSRVGASACSPCPSGFVATYDPVSGSYNLCTCDWGYVNGTAYAPASPCIGCPAGKYRGSPDYQVNGCSDCPQGKYSTTIAATSSSSCAWCPAGKYSLVSGATSSSGCVNCPTNTYGGGASCTCNQGYRFAGLTGGPQECVGCPAGKYNNDYSTYCASCPAGTTSPIGSSSVAACTAIVCGPGTTGPDGGVCTACAAGKYKTSSGSAVCTDCGAGTYSAAVGANDLSTCLACASNANAPSSSTLIAACTCNAGFTGADGGTCSACVAGKSKTNSGSAACADCVAGTWSSATGASACISCGAGGVSPAGSTALAACQFDCASGSTGLPGSCVLCVAGKYKTSAGSDACTDCGAGTYSATVGATVSSTCVVCPVNSNSVVSSSAIASCSCNAGYTGANGGVCTACLVGSFKAQTGSAACALCVNNTFSAETGRSSACEPCQANAVSAAGSASQEYCYCNPGYAHAPGMTTCRICDRGTWNSQLGRTACSNCSVGMYSVNYGAIGSETCLTCPLGQWSFEGSPNCNLCPANSRAGAGSGSQTDCTCDAGYTGADGSTCVPCAAGTYKDASGSAACSACPARMSSAAASLRSSDCWCVTGYIMVSGLCEPMVPRAVAVTGSLQGSSVGNATQALRASIALQLNVSIDLVQIERLPVPDQVRVTIFAGSEADLDRIEAQLRLIVISGLNNTYTTALHGQMLAGQFVECPANYRVYERDQNLARSCGASGNEPCPTSCSSQMNAWTGVDYGPQNANDGVISQESNFVSGCYGVNANGELMCGRHYEWWQVDLLRQRDIKSMTMHITTVGDGFFEDFDIELSNDGITFVKCATHENADLQYLWIRPYKFISTHTCVGSARYFRISSFPRDHMFISEVLVHGETLPGTCQCAPGHMLQPDLSTCAACAGGKYSNATDSRVCTDCPADTYSNDARTACSGCPANSVSAVGTATVLACQCIAGYFFFLAPEGRQCLPCAAGSYKNAAGNVNCTNCSTGSFAAADGSTGCAPCPASTFASAGGAQSCTACPNLTQSVVGSSSVSACACVPGYTGPGGLLTCTACAAGTFKAGNGSAACTACAFGSDSVSGQAACTCLSNRSRQPITTCTTVFANVIASYSSTACSRFIALTPKPSFASISTRNNAAIGILPTYNAAGGPNGNGHVSFDRTMSQYLEAGSRTLNIATNGGLTIVAVARFTGIPNDWERFLELGSGKPMDQVMIYRGSNADLGVMVMNGAAPNVIQHVRGNIITQNSWMTIIFTYRASTLNWVLSVNGGVTSGTASAAITDRTLSSTYMGKSVWSPPYFNGDVAGIFVVDEYLSTVATTAIVDAMVQGVDLTSAACEQTTQSCLSSGIGCSCNSGYTGPETGLATCTACAAGTFKSVGGSAQCSACPARTFSGEVGATSIAACTSCHPNATSAAGSPSEEYCYCEAGFAHVNGTERCALCSQGKYNAQLARTACSNCTVGLYAAGYGSKTVDSCLLCPAGKWSPEGSPDCNMCPVNSAAPARSGLITNCICDANFTGPDGGPCAACAAGKFKAVNGSGACTPCAFGSDSVSGQATCTCTERFVASGSGCAPRDASLMTVNNSIVDLMRSCGASQTEQCGPASGSFLTGNLNGDANGNLWDLNDGNYNTLAYTNCQDSITGDACYTLDLQQERSVTEVVLFFRTDDTWHGNSQYQTYSIRIGNTNVAKVNGQPFTPSSWNTLLCAPKRGTESQWYLQIPGYAGYYQKLTFSCSTTVKGRYLTMMSGANRAFLVELQAFGYLSAQQESIYACNQGYSGPLGGPCTACAIGKYKDTTSTASCISCPANSNSSAGNTNVTACQCNPGYSGPDGGPCVACAAGTAKSVAGSAACGVCAADSFSDASAASVCTACPAGFKALPGTTKSADCCGLNSSPQNITICTISNQDPLSIILATSPAYLMTSAEAWDAANLRLTDLSGNGRHGARTVSPSAWTPLIPAGSVSVGSVTGNGAGFSIPFVGGTASTTIYWPASSIPSTFTICSITRYSGAAKQEIFNAGDTWKQGHHQDKAGSVYYGGWNSEIEKRYLYTLSDKTNWVIACGRNIATPGAISSIVNGVVTSTAAGGSIGNGRLAINGIDPIYGSDWQLSRLYVWNGHLSNAEFAEASAKLNSYVAGVQTLVCVPSMGCSCNTGYTGPDTGASKGQCTTCPPGTYKSTNGSAACTFCAFNTYSTAVGATDNSTCVACPSNAVSAALRTGCLCNFGYTGEAASCVACPAGKFKGVLGTSACVDCPVNTETVGPAAKFCTSVAGFSGLGYALADVARSCGLALNQTCKTLSNGATSNVVGVDGALDANANTFVSVAFNPNLARACGVSGTDACVASNAPVFQGAASLGNDGDINTATRTQYGIQPFWSVDFGSSRSVFAVKILMMIAYGNDGWAFLKDFKITVGDSPVWSQNAVCADYLTGSGRSYVTFACEDTVRGRYLHVIGGPHVDNYVTISEIAVEAFNYTANPALMQPWWAVDFEAERAVAAVSIQTQAAGTVQVRVGHSTDPLQNAVCASGAIIAGVNNTITCGTAMAGRYVSVLGAANSVLVLNEVRVVGAAAAPCAAGTYKSAVGNTNCTACPAFSTSPVGATEKSQCSCVAPYF